jgi:putative flippase GtrA
VYAYGVRTVGRRFTRFAFGSVVALAASEAMLEICLVAHVWPTVAGAAGWFAGAVVSYVLSRWAWERKGKPHLLKETLPFWLIAGGTVIVLSAATSLAQHLALWWGLHPLERLVFVGAAYFAANVLTFLTRFMIFHYFLFADRRSAAGPAAAESMGSAESEESVDTAGSAGAAEVPEAAAAARPSSAPPAAAPSPEPSAARPEDEDVFSGLPGWR